MLRASAAGFTDEEFGSWKTGSMEDGGGLTYFLTHYFPLVISPDCFSLINLSARYVAVDEGSSSGGVRSHNEDLHVVRCLAETFA